MSKMLPLGDSGFVGRGSKNMGFVSFPEDGIDIGDHFRFHDTFGVNRHGDIRDGHTTVEGQNGQRAQLDWVPESGAGG